MTPSESTDFTPGRPVELMPGVRRLVAANGGMMTGPGTNTYIFGQQRLVIVDPGPAIDGQVEAIEAAVAGAQVEAIVVTHTHVDHSPAAGELARRLAAPLLGRRPRHTLYQDAGFEPTRSVEAGDSVDTDIGPLCAVLTPGHASNHVCWHLPSAGLVCTGDHILGNVSPVIVHPDGSLLEYLDSLRRVLDLEPKAFLPGHGPVVLNTRATIERLVAHRNLREQRVMNALQDAGCMSVDALLTRVYADVPPALHGVARHTLLAHLVKLEIEERVVVCGEDAWQAV